MQHVMTMRIVTKDEGEILARKEAGRQRKSRRIEGLAEAKREVEQSKIGESRTLETR